MKELFWELRRVHPIFWIGAAVILGIAGVEIFVGLHFVQKFW